MKDHETNLKTTKEEVENAKKRLEENIREMEDINRQLNEANVDTSESSRMLRKQELIENLKRICSGIIVSHLFIHLAHKVRDIERWGAL